MNPRPLKPHVIVVRIRSEDTYEELWNGASKAGALLFTKAYLREAANVGHEHLRVLEYHGNNIWQVCKVGCFSLEHEKPFQPNLFQGS